MVGLLVDVIITCKIGHRAIAYKKDLNYNSQYRMIDLSTFHFVRYCADDILLLSTKLEKLLHVKVSRLSFLRLTTTSTNLRNQSNKTNLRQRSVSLMVSSLPPSLILFKWKALTRCSTKKSNGFSVWTSARSQAYCPMAQGCFQVRSFKVNDRQSF